MLHHNQIVEIISLIIICSTIQLKKWTIPIFFIDNYKTSSVDGFMEPLLIYL